LGQGTFASQSPITCPKRQLPVTLGEIKVEIWRILIYNNYMKRGFNHYLCIVGIFVAIIFLNCSNIRFNSISLKGTFPKIFLLNNGNNYYFSMPKQYIVLNQFENIEFVNGFILIGEYVILLKRDEINIDVFLNESSDLYGFIKDLSRNVYREYNGTILVSKMNEPITFTEYQLLEYQINIEKYLDNDNIKNIINEYKKGNVNSWMYLKYRITINSERMDDYVFNEEYRENFIKVNDNNIIVEYEIYDDFEIQIN
jgi:hypothetical protein